jgi:hypothetical protein
MSELVPQTTEYPKHLHQAQQPNNSITQFNGGQDNNYSLPFGNEKVILRTRMFLILNSSGALLLDKTRV